METDNAIHRRQLELEKELAEEEMQQSRRRLARAERERMAATISPLNESDKVYYFENDGQSRREGQRQVRQLDTILESPRAPAEPRRGPRPMPAPAYLQPPRQIRHQQHMHMAPQVNIPPQVNTPPQVNIPPVAYRPPPGFRYEEASPSGNMYQPPPSWENVFQQGGNDNRTPPPRAGPRPAQDTGCGCCVM